MINAIYESVQARLNKEQLGYLKPLYYNAFIKIAVRKLYNKLLLDIRTETRKGNFMLEGRNLANNSEKVAQLVEYYSTETENNLTPPFNLPDDLEYIQDVFYNDTRVDKIDYSDLKDLATNIYANPTICSPKCSKVGLKLVVKPDEINSISLHYLRTFKTPKWTFDEFGGRAVFNPDKNDFQDIDMPPFAEDELVSLVTEQASKYLRQFQILQAENQEQSQDFQTENRQ